MTRARLFIPVAVFVVLASFLYLGFTLRDPHELPSALIDKPFPDFDLPLLGHPGERATRADLVGERRLVNVWATWCPTCLAEHGELTRIADETGVSIIGINYKDDPAKARRWLAEYGDPYELNLIDPDGALGVELGVYGAPETFLLNAGGDVVFKQVGAIDGQVWQQEIAPRLAAMGVPVADGEARSDAG